MAVFCYVVFVLVLEMKLYPEPDIIRLGLAGIEAAKLLKRWRDKDHSREE